MEPGLDATLQRERALTGAARGRSTGGVATTFALCVAAGAVAMTAGLASPELDGSRRLLAVTALPVLLAPLFVRAPQVVPRPSIRPVVDWAIATLLLAVFAWFVAGGWSIQRMMAPLAVALGVVLVTSLAADVIASLARRAGIAATAAYESARWLVVAVLWLLAAAPLWLGPVADLASRDGPAAAGAIVAMSPLVHLAVAAGQDLLRTQWFYAHSSLGSLQFDYPSLVAIAAGYAVVVAMLASCRFVLSRRATATGPLPRALPT